MTHRRLIGVLSTAALALLGVVPAASAHERRGRPAARGDAFAQTAGAVFVQTNESSGNRVLVFDRTREGRLVPAGSYSTGGRGATAVPGTQSDHLASQGSLAYDAQHQVLIAVNAGSDSVSAFSVHGDRLRLTSVVGSDGPFPASLAVHGDLVYVLDSGGHGSVHGYRLDGNTLRSIPGSTRSLGLDNTDPPFFLTSPGEVGFTPSGGQLIVTTKMSGSTIDVFSVASDGRLSSAPVRTPSATPVPFAFAFTPSGRLAVGEAGMSDVSTYIVESSGALTSPRSQSDGQTALCWIQRIGAFYYVSNTGSNTLAAFRIADSGQPSLVGVVASTPPGPIDDASPPESRLLYTETGGGTVQEFRTNADGTLTRLGAVEGLPVGIEGIVAT
jgi:hypothetical protein